MFICKLFVIFLTVDFIFQVESHISIGIDPEDMDRVSDFFEGIIFNSHPIVQQPARPRCSSIIRLTKKFLISAIQMFGIMITLVGANLLTSKLSGPVPANCQNELFNELEKNVTSIIEKCEIDFGCNRGLCWRSCTVQQNYDKNYTSWCFAAPGKQSKKFQQCKNHLECSGCWPCSYPCVRKGVC